MYRNETIETEVIIILAISGSPRLKPQEITDQINEMREDLADENHLGFITLDEAWNAIHMLTDQGFLAKASNTADYYRITFSGYAAYADNI